jgi:outer membrane protein TolC
MNRAAWTRERKDFFRCRGSKHIAGTSSVARRAILSSLGIFLAVAGAASQARAQEPSPPDENKPTAEAQLQLVQPPGANNATPPVTITLQDAIERARKNDGQFLAAVNGAKSSREDRLQARNAILPQFSYTAQALLTQGNGGRTNIGRFVTNDGVHVYRSWGVLHEDLSPNNYMGTAYRRAGAAAAIANAEAEIAKRGLTVTVTKFYYALADSQRKYATAQSALDTAKHFFDITQDSEYRQLEQAFEEAQLAMESARMDLAVLVFPAINENFSMVDDLDSPVALPPFVEAERMAARENPELSVAMETLRGANLDVTAAKGAFLPAFFVDADYGIEANAFALHSVNVEEQVKGPLPNLGYFVTVGVNVPVWDWGTMRSKLHQSELKREQARAELSQAQRQLVNNLYGSYNDAMVARAAVEESRRMAELAAESMRLIGLRYRAGASTALEVVSAENTLTQARNSYDDAQVRYRVALATLQTVTGNF